MPFGFACRPAPRRLHSAILQKLFGKAMKTMLKLHGRPVAGAMWLYFLHRRRASPRPCGRLPAADIMFTMGGDGGRRAALQLAQRAVLRCHAACLACWNGLFGKAKQAVLQPAVGQRIAPLGALRYKNFTKSGGLRGRLSCKASTGHAGQHLPCVAGMWLKRAYGCSFPGKEHVCPQGGVAPAGHGPDNERSPACGIARHEHVGRKLR